MVEVAQIRLASKRIEHGGWMDNIPDMGNLRLLVRGTGCTLDREARDEARRESADAQMGLGFTPEESENLTRTLIRDVFLLGWENLELEPGRPLPYSAEAAAILIEHPDFVPFRVAVLWAADRVGSIRKDDDLSDVREQLAAYAAQAQTPARSAKRKPKS